MSLAPLHTLGDQRPSSLSLREMGMKARCCDNSPGFYDELLVREQRAMSTVTCFVGLDYHQDSVQVCVLDGGGRQLLNRSCPNDWRAIAGAAASAGAVKRAAVEACCGAADLAEELAAKAGWQVDLAHPGYVERMKRSPDKTDFTDGRMLADLTRVGYLPKVYLPSSYERDLRHLVNHRQSLVDQRRAAKLRVGALLREHRARPAGADSKPRKKTPGRWTKAWVAWASSAPQLSGHARWVVAELLAEVVHLDGRVEAADGRLREATRQDPPVARLMGEPGGGRGDGLGAAGVRGPLRPLRQRQAVVALLRALALQRQQRRPPGGRGAGARVQQAAAGDTHPGVPPADPHRAAVAGAGRVDEVARQARERGRRRGGQPLGPRAVAPDEAGVYELRSL